MILLPVFPLYDTFIAYKNRESVVRAAFLFTGVFMGALGSEALKKIVSKEAQGVFPIPIAFSLAAFWYCLWIGNV